MSCHPNNTGEGNWSVTFFWCENFAKQNSSGTVLVQLVKFFFLRFVVCVTGLTDVHNFSTFANKMCVTFVGEVHMKSIHVAPLVAFCTYRETWNQQI